jgi:DNA-sulfur modification-associated
LKYAFINRYRRVWQISVQCRVLEASVAGYHEHFVRAASTAQRRHLTSHSTVLRALGGLGLDLLMNDDWKARLAALEQIDWSKKNKDWDNICIVANSVVSNRQAQAATKAYVKGKLGLELSDSEQRSLDRNAANAQITIDDL